MAADNLALERAHLLDIVYRILGSMSDTEDVVQETLLRWHRKAPDDVRSPRAWLVTVATRLAIDRLRARKTEHYVGPWLPEPVASDVHSNPEARAVAEADLSLAFLSMLERLTPEERAALILREVFQYSYDDISSIFDRRQDACRQLVHRAKSAVRGNRKRKMVRPADKERIVRLLLRAMESGDEITVLQLVAPDSHWISDGGGKVVGAATRIVKGYDRVTRLALGLSRRFVGRIAGRIVSLLGESAIAWYDGDALVDVVAIETDGERINGFYSVLNPDKLTRVSPL